KPIGRYKAFLHAKQREDNWRPSQHSRICSRHFENGKKLDIPESKSYVPTLELPKKSFQTARRKIVYRGKIGKQNSLLLAMLAAEPDLDAFKDEESNVHISEQTPKSFTVDRGTQYDVSDIPVSTVPPTEHDYCFPVTKPAEYMDIDSLKSYTKSLVEKLEKQTDKLTDLKARIANLIAEVESYRSREFTLGSIKNDDKAVNFYTGFQSYNALIAFYKFLESKAENLQYWRNSKTTSEPQYYQTLGRGKPGRKRTSCTLNELFMVLVRLKVGLFVEDISNRFNISCSTFSRTFTTWIIFLYYELKLLFPFPTQSQIRNTMPAEFVQYPTTRIIIDCTELFVEVPTSLLAQNQTWSNYKHHNTFKAMVGISPNGAVTFISDLYGGRISDKEITKKSGLCEILESGDNVMADRGFEIKGILPAGVDLNIPPFKGTRAKLTAREVQDTMDIASVRIHVERAIGRIKKLSYIGWGSSL
ncbi:uncharacterized protein LOC100368694, partial [Saccoglossus kowalevskii]|uniref:Uncharacterized protein LOC100368694 n=1 Tax=Saccoglossus kowalevskii TaxID=10224 RepID=A0ABM0GZ53_SACKO